MVLSYKSQQAVRFSALSSASEVLALQHARQSGITMPQYISLAVQYRWRRPLLERARAVML
jgi:hypothetical protein